MKKIFSFLCMLMAMTAMISCSSSKEEKGTTGTGNAALDNIFERKSVRTRNAIIVCGDSARSFYWYLDCSAAAQNILLAAESMGLGAVWTAAYPYEDRMEVVRKYTHLPENILPLCVIPFGYPATKEQPKQKYDEKKIHYNQY